MSSIQEVERHLIQVAVSRGYLSQESLERAAKFRQKLTERGRRTQLVAVLHPYLRPEHHRELEQIWARTSRALTTRLEQATQSNPGHLGTWLDLAQVRLALGQAPRALRDLEACSQRVQGAAPEFYLVRGEVLAALGRAAEARVDLERLLAMAPGGARALRAHEILAHMR